MKIEEAYDILGVTKDSAETEVKSAYKKLALKTVMLHLFLKMFVLNDVSTSK